VSERDRGGLDRKADLDDVADVVIRDARLSDVPAIAVLAQERRLQYAKYQPQFWNVAPDAERVHRPWLEGLVCDNSVVSLVAEREGASGVCGFLFAAVGPTPPVYDAGGDTATIDDFVVSPPNAWMIIGTALLDAGKARLREQGVAQIVVVCGEQDGPKRCALADAGLSVASEWYVGDLRSQHDA
jgi:ribosomal protein S18 acetylase RimI-like enzyme